MSISQDSGAVVVCREVFDEASHPSNEEILEYARKVGIDPDTEPHLLDLARDGLMAPLPKGWTPCHYESTGAWYYYQASTGTTTWEHPLDAKNRALVERARATGNRQQSLDDDSKTTAKDLDSHEEATLPKEPKIAPTMTKIPTKLAPLRKSSLESMVRSQTQPRVETSNDRSQHQHQQQQQRRSTTHFDDRASLDYTNYAIQDPKFYEAPKLLGEDNNTSDDHETRLKEIVKRSESMSPRYEKDWEQLSSRFISSDDNNVIDIDKLSASSLTMRTDNKSVNDKFDKEKHPRKITSQPKELTLSGGGSVFLKSNSGRSRDPTPCKDRPDTEEALRPDNDLPTTSDNDNTRGNLHSERPRSILRDKPTEVEERANDEERKSVRFDLEKDPEDIKFTFTSFDDDDEDDLEDFDDPENKDKEDCATSDSDSTGIGSRNFRRIGLKSLFDGKHPANLWRGSVDARNGKYDPEAGNDLEEESTAKERREAIKAEDKATRDSNPEVGPEVSGTTAPDGSTNDVPSREDNATETSGTLKERKAPKIVSQRFQVENVSEKEHLSQLMSQDSTDRDIPISDKFNNIRNIDIFSRSETESNRSVSGSSRDETKSLLLEDIRRSKEIMLEDMRRTEQRARRDKQRERDQAYQMMKLRHDLEAVGRETRGRSASSRAGSLSDIKQAMSKQQERELLSFRRELEARLEASRSEMEANLAVERANLEAEMERRREELRRDMRLKEEREIGELVAEMDELRMENLDKVRNELEMCYENERQDILNNMKIELDQRKRELLELRNREMDKLISEHESEMAEERTVKIAELQLTKQQNDKVEEVKRQLDKELEEFKNELRCQQREKIMKITEDHEKCLSDILKDFRMDENLARKVYKQRLEEIRSDFTRDTEKEAKKQAERATRQETMDFEKIRCEKRLLEDKYKTLKDKYSKLKNDVRLAVERRSKRREGNVTTSETERSTSARTRTERTDSSDQKASPANTRSNSIASTGYPRSQQPVQQQQPGDQQSNNPNKSTAEEPDCGQRSTMAFTRSATGDCSSRSSVKFESDDATTASETVNSSILKNKRKTFARRSSSSAKQSNGNNSIGSANNNNNNNSSSISVTDNPVENIRKQLEKLEDLGDQLPSNETAYTLRYPFQDKAPANASSELEFFRHRIHVERDSVKRAREALRVQRSAFQNRQRAWKQKSVRATLEQLVQEERELSDMEVSLHRTRSLLGEKVIYLRHLEQSLERVANAKRNESDISPSKNDELTLSDMSSASSGFSSTDVGTDTFIGKSDHYQESTEIIASLENLNSEIREIWGVLNKRQDNNIPPPPTFMYSDLGWLPYQHLTTTQSNSVQGFGTPNIQSNILSQLTAAHPPTTTTQNIIAQYGPSSGFTTSVGNVERGTSSLIERTRHMRDWLRQARIESTDLISPGQATL